MHLKGKLFFLKKDDQILKMNTIKLLNNDFLKLSPFYLFFTILVLTSSNNFFFWDTVQLASRHAQWYYDNNFRYFLLPDSIDSGHIPFFGLSLAIIWKIFHKSLFISHLFILPFLLGIVYQSYKLVQHFFSKKNLFFVLIIFLLDPTLLSQSILVSPDIMLVFFFLYALNMILKNNRIHLIFGILGLSLISMRGMMVCIILFIFDLYLNYSPFHNKNGFIKLLDAIKPYLPAAFLSLAFFIYHYSQKGWIGYHPDSPWAPCFEKVDFNGFIRNIFILTWRLIDYGRIFLWISFFGIFILKFREIKFNTGLKVLLILCSVFILLFPLTMLTHKNLLGHRYLLPVYLVFSLLTCYLVFEQFENNKLKYLFLTVITAGLLTGNLWVYPEKIAQGWDSTLAHMPYYKLRSQMINYIRQNRIPYSDIGTEFPNLASFKYIDLENEDIGFVKKDLKINRYIFYSNVMNDFTDEEIELLYSKWIIEKELRLFQVKIILFKNPVFN